MALHRVAGCRVLLSIPTAPIGFGDVGDRALGIHTFEVADQQQPEVASRRQSWPALVSVESLTNTFDESVEVLLSKRVGTKGR